MRWLVGVFPEWGWAKLATNSGQTEAETDGAGKALRDGVKQARRAQAKR